MIAETTAVLSFSQKDVATILERSNQWDVTILQKHAAEIIDWFAEQIQFAPIFGI